MAHTATRKAKFSSLFLRLIFSFFIVMLIPASLLGFVYFTTGNRAVVSNLTEQGNGNIAFVAKQLEDIIDEYRHKAYVISVLPEIIDVLEADTLVNPTSMYELLFSIMQGDTYLACASVVSISGRVRLSTHLFPQHYDLRYYGNEANPFFDISRAKRETASLITMDNRYRTPNNSFVFLNIFRRVFGTTGEVVGYVVVDLYEETVSQLASGLVFSDLLLINREKFTATSLVHTQRYGDFSNFPELKALSAPLADGSYQMEGTIVSIASIPNTPLMVAGVTNTTLFAQSIEWFFFVMVLVLLIGIGISGVFAYHVSRSIALPVGRLAASMRRVEGGDLTVQVAESPVLELAQLERTFNTMVRQITFLLDLTREEEAKLHESERKALEAQMNPHFLYNTLNTVKAIAKLHGEQEILTITTQLGKLLRHAADNREKTVSLKESFALVEGYLAIQRIRFGTKLNTVLYLDERIADICTPKLIVQPFVENALIHGLEPKVGTWRLTVKAVFANGWIIITIADNGVGIAPGKLPKNLDALDGSQHIGIYNIYRRLKLYYDGNFSLVIDSAEGEGTTVTIRLPMPESGVS